MNLTDVLTSQIHAASQPVLECDDTLKKIEGVFYVEPPVQEVRLSEDSQMLLFSAPGAVGKSTLAKYIACQYQGLYWNIADTRVGDSTFWGTIGHAIGPEHPQEAARFLENLRGGDALIVLDSFDEAALTAGNDGIRSFLSEIHRLLHQPGRAGRPGIVLTARNETALLIVSLCDKLRIPLSHYTIGYFTEQGAVEFVCRYIEEKLGGKKLSPAWRKYVEEQLTSFKEHLGDENAETFIGYAPVLEAVSKQVKKTMETEDNPYKIKTDFANVTDKGQMIYSIIESLIKREQEKIKPFCQSIEEKYAEKPEVLSSLYGKEEQLARLLSYLLFEGDTEYENFNSRLLAEDAEAYGGLLRDWLPQHVFLAGDGLGPVFRDYMVAELLRHETLNSFLSDFLEARPNYLPSHILMDCYLAQRDQVDFKHVQMLMDSFLSGVPTDRIPFCEIYEEEDASGSVKVFFLMRESTPRGADAFARKVEMNPADDPIIELSHASNLSVNLHGTVRLTQGKNPSVFRNCFIECENLEFETAKIIIAAYGPQDKCCLSASRSMNRGAKLNVEVEENAGLQVMLPDGGLPSELYMLKKYCVDWQKDEDDGISIGRFVYMIKKILEQLKVDSYGNNPAKYKEKIDARVTTQTGRKVLRFLMDEKIIYEDKKFYYCNRSKLDEHGISRVAYMLLQEAEFQELHEKFLHWCRKG